MKFGLFFIIYAILGPNGPLFAQNTATFQVIVNESNPNSELTREEVSNLFLKKITRWKLTGDVVCPADQLDSSNIRKKFTHKVHQKKIEKIKIYWQQQIFSGRKIPPVEKNSDLEVIKYVARKKGAIGYVSASADIRGYNVKVIVIVKNLI